MLFDNTVAIWNADAHPGAKILQFMLFVHITQAFTYIFVAKIINKS